MKRITVTSPVKTERGRLMPDDTPTVDDDLAAELEELGVAVIDGDAEDGASGPEGGAAVSAPPSGDAPPPSSPEGGGKPTSKGRAKAGK